MKFGNFTITAYEIWKFYHYRLWQKLTWGLNLKDINLNAL